MSAPPDSPLLADWGRYRRQPGRSLPRWLWPLVAVSIVGLSALGAWIATRPHPWRPPSGAPAFRSCTYGGYVDGWCASVRAPEDPRRPAGPTIALHVTVLPATTHPAAGAMFYLEGGPVPYALDQAAHGDYRVRVLAEVYASQLGGSNLDPLARSLRFRVILCSEPWARFDPGATARDGRGSYLAAAALARARLYEQACRVAPKGRVPPASARLEVMRAHVLLLAGGDDPQDPVANLRGWRRAFPNGRLVVVPGAGHGTIDYGCVQKLVARFVDRGTAAGIDPSCVRHVALPPFVVG
jgi:hypothetical protein